MKSLLKAVGICFLTIFVLCLTINGKPVFEPVYNVLSHLTIPFQNGAESVLASVFDSTQDYSRKLFNNSVPKVKDAVKSRASAPVRGSSIKNDPKEEILLEEKEELDELIKSHY